MKHSAILLVLLLAPVVAGQHPHDAVCRVACPIGNGMESYDGSGTLIGVADGRGLVISAAHVFEGCNTQAVRIRFPRINRVFRGRVIGTNRAYDLAALDIEAPPDVATPKVAIGRREDGPYTCVGYPKGGPQRFVTGEYLGYPSGRGMSAWASSMLHTRTHVISGYSGGARFNRRGEYVGVVSGMTGPQMGVLDRTWGAANTALIEFVKQYMEVK